MKTHDRITEQAMGRPVGRTPEGEARQAPFTPARPDVALPLTVGAEDIAEFVEKLDRALELRRQQEAFDPGI